MRIAYELCLATAGKQVPDGPDWIHEVKHDGYRMLVIRENERVRLLSRNDLLFALPYPQSVCRSRACPDGLPLEASAP